MLSQVNRLKKKKDIERVLKKGRGIKEDFLILKIIRNDLNQIRIGFIVSQKVSKKANIRNKVKRRLREMVRAKLKEIKVGRDIILIAVPGLEKKDFITIKENLNQLFKKAKINNG